MANSLILLGKQPIRGQVKTRLAVTYGTMMATEAHRAMLLDAIDRWGSREILEPSLRRILAFDPPSAQSWFADQAGDRWCLQPQIEGNLGQRVLHVMAGAFQQGSSAVVAIGTDSPTLDPEIVRMAFAGLGTSDVVLGPSTDGGYYLIGMRQMISEVFQAISWSTSRVLQQTVERLENVGASLTLLPPWYDIDVGDDWQMLIGHLQALRRIDSDVGLPRLEAMIQSWKQGLFDGEPDTPS